MKRFLFIVVGFFFLTSAPIAFAATFVIPSSVSATQTKQLKQAETDTRTSPRDASAWFTLAEVYRSIVSSSTASFVQNGYWDALRKGITLRYDSLSQPKTVAEAYTMARLYSDDWTENRGLAGTSPWRDMDAYAKLMTYVSTMKNSPGWETTSTSLLALEGKDATLENANIQLEVMPDSLSMIDNAIESEQNATQTPDETFLDLRFSLWQLTMGFACGVTATVFVFIVWQLLQHAVMHHEHVVMKPEGVVIKPKRTVKRRK